MQDDPQRRKPDITRARTILGWEPKVKMIVFGFIPQHRITSAIIFLDKVVHALAQTTVGMTVHSLFLCMAVVPQLVRLSVIPLSISEFSCTCK